MGRSKKEAEELARRFLENAEKGDNVANDQVVRDADRRDSFIVESDES